MKFLKVLSLLFVPVLLLASLVFLKTQSSSYGVYVIHTGSMSPNIPSGSAVLVHKGHFHVGQVVTYTEQGLTITHRLLSISSKGLITTKGDGNPTTDPWHPPVSRIIGGVVVAPRWIGYWIVYFKSPAGLVSLLLAVLAVWQLWAMTGDASRESDGIDEPPSVDPSERRRRFYSTSRVIRREFYRRRIPTSHEGEYSRYAHLFGHPKSSQLNVR